MNCQNPTA